MYILVSLLAKVNEFEPQSQLQVQFWTNTFVKVMNPFISTTIN